MLLSGAAVSSGATSENARSRVKMLTQLACKDTACAADAPPFEAGTTPPRFHSARVVAEQKEENKL
jgi:hypothetical protein